MRLLIAILLSGSAVAAESPIDFSREVLPILSDKCFICHGPDTNENTELRLDTVAGATLDLGGYRAVDQQKPSDSELLSRIHDADSPMPPADADKQLTDNERRLLTAWIKQGGQYAEHWAFVPPEKAAIELSDINPIDFFIGHQLKESGHEFATEADRSTLARRVALTLTGLPPEPVELAAYLNDDSDDAYDQFVTRLLDSPRFGEHQARYWLDAVRYGDTHGLHLDNRRGIYPYRDWVVRSLNDNLPLNEFIKWQLAGDLLPDPTMSQLIASGYVRMNPTTSEGGALPQEFQAKNNFDRTENLGTVFLGMSLTCARCHTHKYDPILQTEYYQLLAFFNSTAEPPMDRNAYEFGPTLRVPADQAAWKEWKELTDERRRLVQAAEQHVPPEQHDEWDQASEADRFATLVSNDGSLASSEAKELAARIEAAEKAFTTTLVARDLEEPRSTHVLRRGEYNLPIGDELTPDVPAIMGQLPENAPRNRLGLAQWLTSRQHPLVARVLTNRIWQRTFGTGLVRTPEDFGVQGQQPTHPELLDWLSVQLQDSGWNLKELLRLMVTSHTFRQTSAVRDELNDPENQLWGRGPAYRLDAEVIRDVGLWSSGLLDPHMGGEGVKPWQPAGMWKALAHPGSNTKNYVPDEGTQTWRRSLYVYWKRTSPHPMMTLFDAPDRESSCVRRGRTSTPLQSLGLLNEIQRVEMGRSLAHRLLTTSTDDSERLHTMFTYLASRSPSDAETSACLDLVHTMKSRFSKTPSDADALLNAGSGINIGDSDRSELAAWTQLAITVLASDTAIMLY